MHVITAPGHAGRGEWGFWDRAVRWGGWHRVAGWAGWGRVARELLLVAVLAGAYEEIGRNMVQAGSAAASHALSVVHAERALGLFHEQAVQAVFVRWDTVTDAFNAYYGGTHFLIPAIVLAWLLLRHPERYGRARTSLVATTAVAFVCFWLYPVAPPRLLPASFGIVDTMRTTAPGHVESTLINAAGDQYASMPSLHVAWAVWCALALYPVVRHRVLRGLIIAYPVMTTAVVIATGNHYFLDALAGGVLAWISAKAAGAVRRRDGQVVRRGPALAHEPAGDRGADRLVTVGGHERHDRAAEAAAGHPGPGRTVVDRGLDGHVGLRPGHPEPVAQRPVRLGQQLAERERVARPQQLDRPQDAAVLGHDVPGHAAQVRVG
jgi:membrane-associated phospholipid phosphatase